MTAPPVLGDFLGPAAEHIAAPAAFRSELPYDAQRGVIRQLDRLVATMGRLLADLPDDPGSWPGPERDAGTRITTAKLALGRAAQNLRPAGAAAAADTSADRTHPAIGHLSAAADHLAAGRDLLNTHFTADPDGARTTASYWAPVITSGPVTAAEPVRELCERIPLTAERLRYAAFTFATRAPGHRPPGHCHGAGTPWPRPSPATPASSSCARSPNVPASSAWSPSSAPG
jgi:hypothetical protein